MSEALTEAQFNRLSRTVLGNPSASVRKEALLEIRKLDHPALGAVLKQVAAEDKDDEVRDLAQNLLRKYEIDQALKHGSFETPTAVAVPEVETKSEPEPDWLQRDYPSEPKTTTIGELLESSGKPVWTCRFCGTENTGGDTCASCGAERSRERIVEEDVPRKRKARDNAGFGDVFLLDPSNMRFLLGQVKVFSAMSAFGTGCTVLFLLPFLAIGLFVIVMAGTEWRSYHLLNTTGVMTRGEFTNKYITTDDDDGGTNYHIEYLYEVNERPFMGSDTVSRDAYNRAGIGEPISIVYAPSDPGISALEGANDISSPIFLTVFAAFWNLISWGVFLAMIVGLFRDRQLSRHGQTVRGELMSISGHRGSKGKYYVTAHYNFLPPGDSELLTGQTRAQRNDLRGAALPDKGTPVMVLYRNRSHFKML